MALSKTLGRIYTFVVKGSNVHRKGAVILTMVPAEKPDGRGSTPGTRFLSSHNVPGLLRGPPSLLFSASYRCFLQEQNKGTVKLTTHLQLIT